ncbi:paramyosin-like [Uloborus diversus]|uniref:paramyosin-like n=1 Tax=Uloborus diversus TaxID=327109 RepID=UPI002409C346|nr:paramyosin-like [Uloborus diversus]
MSEVNSYNKEVSVGTPSKTGNEGKPGLDSTTPELKEPEYSSTAEAVSSNLNTEKLSISKENLNNNVQLLDTSRNLKSEPNVNETDISEFLAEESISEDSLELNKDKSKNDKSSAYFCLRVGESILNDKDISHRLDEMADDVLRQLHEEIQEQNLNLSLENEVFEYILCEDEAVRNTLAMVEIDQELSPQDYTLALSSAEKCCFAQKKLEQVQKELEIKEIECKDAIQSLKFKVESLDISLKELQEEKSKFDANIRYGGRHPVTKKVVLQKVMKYFDDSIKHKMEMSNKFKVRMQHDTMEQNKILNQVKTKQKRLASLNVTEFQQAELAHKNSCDTLNKYKEQLGKCKSKFSPLIQDMAKLKKDLAREKLAMEEMKDAVLKQEHLKEIMLFEKTRNDQRARELEPIQMESGWCGLAVLVSG